MATKNHNDKALALPTPENESPSLAWTSLDQIAIDLASGPQEFVLLTGVEAGWAGLSPADIARPGYNFSVGCAFSFCLNGKTYTALEDEQDDYRSALGLLLSREGNHCSTKFEPCALWPVFVNTEERASLDLLVHPGEPRAALSVGTKYLDEYYPSFEGYHVAELLQRAHDMGIALATELDETLAAGSALSTKARL